MFTNLLLADEINRAAPKVQSALLEAMQERKVSIGNNSPALPVPFLVIGAMESVRKVHVSDVFMTLRRVRAADALASGH